MDTGTAKNRKSARLPAKCGAGAGRPLQMRSGLRGRSLKPRELRDLISIGPAMLRDFEVLGIRSVGELARQNPQRLHEKLGRVAHQHQDICVLDVFRAAVAQARNPRLPAEQCQWWYWSRKRRQGGEQMKRQRSRG